MLRLYRHALKDVTGEHASEEGLEAAIVLGSDQPVINVIALAKAGRTSEGLVALMTTLANKQSEAIRLLGLINGLSDPMCLPWLAAKGLKAEAQKCKNNPEDPKEEGNFVQATINLTTPEEFELVAKSCFLPVALILSKLEWGETGLALGHTPFAELAAYAVDAKMAKDLKPLACLEGIEFREYENGEYEFSLLQ